MEQTDFKSTTGVPVNLYGTTYGGGSKSPIMTTGGLKSKLREEPEEADSIVCQSVRLLISLLLCPALGLAAIISIVVSSTVSVRNLRSSRRSQVAPPTADNFAELAKKAIAKRAAIESLSADLALFGIIYGALNLAVVVIVFGLTAWKGTLGYS